MKKLILILVFTVLYPGCVLASAAFVQGNKLGSTASPASVTFSSNVTAGDAMVACGYWGSPGTTAFSDNHSGSYSDTGNGVVTLGVGGNIQCECSIASTTASYTITLTAVGQTFFTTIQEYSGLTCTSDGHNNQTAVTATGGAFNSGTFTTTVNGDMLIGFGYNPSGDTVNAATNYTKREFATAWCVEVEKTTPQTTAGSGTSVNFTTTSGDTNIGVLGFALEPSGTATAAKRIGSGIF